MIFLICALYPEARPFIEEFGLKRDHESSSFQIFKSDSVILIISGTGATRSATAASHLLTKFQDDAARTLVVNIGSCAANSGKFQKGDIILINSIFDQNSGQWFYPDLMWLWPYEEAPVQTISKPAHEKLDAICPLIDMEAAGFFVAASHFAAPHEIQVIKVVLDKTLEKQKPYEELGDIMKDAAQRIAGWLVNVHAQLQQNKRQTWDKNKGNFLSLIAQNLKLSSTMYHELKRLVAASPLSDEQIASLLDAYSNLDIRHKREGKMHFRVLMDELSKRGITHLENCRQRTEP